MKTLFRIACLLVCISFLFHVVPTRAASAAPRDCAYNPVVADLLARTSATRWLDWIEKLSGKQFVTIDGDPYTINTRDTQSMFSARDNARAFDYVEQTVRSWVRPEQIERDEYTSLNGLPWYNLIVTFPGTRKPEEVVILSAHLDSKSETKPLTQAPGADDNATGSAALLEAVRLFREVRFEHTVKLIFFTGEELGMLGSSGYVKDHEVRNIIAVFNMDMFGYDSDDDRCFEIHAGKLPASLRAADCVTASIQAYDIDLKAEVVTELARAFSDHGSFWAVDTGAVLLMQNFFRQNIPGGCGLQDPNPMYHSTGDTIESLNPSYGFDIARAGIAAAAGLAVAVHPYYRTENIQKPY
jgi:hypothetical protein